jgi:hypothetical protein
MMWASDSFGAKRNATSSTKWNNAIPRGSLNNSELKQGTKGILIFKKRVLAHEKAAERFMWSTSL